MIFLFSFLIGADPVYKPVVTSYGYDAPLTEAGDTTDKYMAIRTLISKVCYIVSLLLIPLLIYFLIFVLPDSE